MRAEEQNKKCLLRQLVRSVAAVSPHGTEHQSVATSIGPLTT